MKKQDWKMAEQEREKHRMRSVVKGPSARRRGTSSPLLNVDRRDPKKHEKIVMARIFPNSPIDGRSGPCNDRPTE